MSSNNNQSRRRFLLQTAKGSAALTLGASGMAHLFTSCASPKNISIARLPTGYTQQPLPYKYDALENVIDKLTMEIHYSRHAATYAKNLNEAVLAEGIDTSKPLEDMLSNVSRYSLKMRNNGGGHYNHEMFWKCMRPAKASNLPTGKLLAAIEKSFTSFKSFQTQFNEVAKSRFGSGWAWLYSDKDRNLKIGSTPNQDNPLMNISDIKGYPLLCLDVWEHAYYLKYQNKRPEYIENWWKVVNWDYVQQRFEFV